ncbi:MAG: polysaccharide deacetylase family protein [Deltaproteobacteria bacterium]|nr:polysaccharide deacetylase family protein [Deltaproteobacteria bacterium]
MRSARLSNRHRIAVRQCALLTIGVLLSVAHSAAAQPERLVAVTIDDLPFAGPRSRSVEANLRKLVAQLKQLAVPTVGFVNAGKGQLQAMRLWKEAGFPIGNHTLTHPAYSRIEPQAFISDIRRNEQIVRQALGVELRGGYFRYPYLDHGHTEDKLRAVNAYLRHHRYTVAHVSLDTSDWAFANHYRGVANASVAALYLAHIQDCATHFEALSKRLFGREIALILLLHANQLNADHIGKVIQLLRGRGYRTIALSEALKDPAYRPYRIRPPLVALRGDRNFLNQIALTRGLRIEDPTGGGHFRRHWKPVLELLTNTTRRTR